MAFHGQDKVINGLATLTHILKSDSITQLFQKSKKKFAMELYMSLLPLALASKLHSGTI